MARKPKVSIVGGGIGGLAAGLALQRRGVDVTVFEQSGRLSEIGAGLNLSPNALKAFRALGIEDAAIAVGCQTEFQTVRSWRSGRVITRLARGSGAANKFGATFLTIHRADLLAILGRAVSEDRLSLGAKCVAVETRSNSTVARFADGSEFESDIVVGADGIHSSVRESLLGPDQPRFTGCVCWRGLVPVELVADQPGINEVTSWWGPHGHVVTYPVRRGELINFVAHFDSDAWTQESWTHECELSELTDTYARWNGALLRLFAHSEKHYKWALYDRDPLDRWGAGGATLLGDAAHPMLPYLGQGSGMAVEDACILASCIDTSPGDPAEALRRYESLRMPRTRRAQLGSRHRAKENHLTSPVARAWRDIRLSYRSRFGADKTPLQAAWLYEFDVADVAVAREA